jgi:hypothetical protein
MATNFRRDVFTSALRSNERGEAGRATLFTVVCFTQQQAANTHSSIFACVLQGFCVSTVPAWGKYATIYACIHTYIHPEMAKLMGSVLQICLGKCAQSIETRKGNENDEETGWNIFTTIFKTFTVFLFRITKGMS